MDSAVICVLHLKTRAIGLSHNTCCQFIWDGQQSNGSLEIFVFWDFGAQGLHNLCTIIPAILSNYFTISKYNQGHTRHQLAKVFVHMEKYVHNFGGQITECCGLLPIMQMQGESSLYCMVDQP